MNATDQFRTFENLEAYQAARLFRKEMYGVTGKLPDFEKFELASQIRRAAVSLTNNIAEGHGRYHYLDQIEFMLHARGSLEELMDDVNVGTDERYLSEDDITRMRQQASRVAQLIGGYIRFLRNCKAGQNLALHESPADCGAADDLPI